MDLSPFSIENDDGSVLMIMQVNETSDGDLVCGIKYVEGTIAGGPKRWVSAVRRELRTLENLARDVGCKEMRVGGRDWSRVLPDYEPLDGIPNGLRKAL